MAEDGKEKRVTKHNYINLKHRRGTIITNRNEVKKRKIDFDIGPRKTFRNEPEVLRT